MNRPDWMNPQVMHINREAPRATLVPFACEARQRKWDFGPSLNARFERTVLPMFAKALYRERLANYMENHPLGEVEYLNDPRFDAAAIVRSVRDDGMNLQAFVGWRDRAAIYQTIAMGADLGEHIDAFAEILEIWQ